MQSVLVPAVEVAGFSPAGEQPDGLSHTERLADSCGQMVDGSGLHAEVCQRQVWVGQFCFVPGVEVAGCDAAGVQPAALERTVRVAEYCGQSVAGSGFQAPTCQVHVQGQLTLHARDSTCPSQVSEAWLPVPAVQVRVCWPCAVPQLSCAPQEAEHAPQGPSERGALGAAVTGVIETRPRASQRFTSSHRGGQSMRP